MGVRLSTTASIFFTSGCIDFYIFLGYEHTTTEERYSNRFYLSTTAPSALPHGVHRHLTLDLRPRSAEEEFWRGSPTVFSHVSFGSSEHVRWELAQTEGYLEETFFVCAVSSFGALDI